MNYTHLTNKSAEIVCKLSNEIMQIGIFVKYSPLVHRLAISVQDMIGLI